MKKYIFPSLVVILIVMQFFRIDQSNPEYDVNKSFETLQDPPVEISNILKNACYDCHSHETVYPWYSNVAPISWWLQDHINEGKSHLNFSEWGLYDRAKRAHKAEEITEEVAESEMPLQSYTWAHSKARLSDKEIETLVSYFNDLNKELSSGE